MLQGLHWLGHASFRIDAELVIYIDPWKLTEAKPADLVLVTHGHGDHLSPTDIARIAGESTILVCPPSCAEQLSGDVRTVRPGESLRIGEVRIEAVPSYNTNKPNHPREAGNVGYVVEVGGRRIYHAGDTDLIPEMAQIQCDVALLPMGGTYTMNAQEAAQAAARIEPKVVVPMHWGDIVGSRADVDLLAQELPKEIKLVVLDPEH
jgi:L-ascorbate metabolism protein UlaG (beta-lactamase superfamily)